VTESTGETAGVEQKKFPDPHQAVIGGAPNGRGSGDPSVTAASCGAAAPKIAPEPKKCSARVPL
jgi:hypothetical protein